MGKNYMLKKFIFENICEVSIETRSYFDYEYVCLSDEEIDKMALGCLKIGLNKNNCPYVLMVLTPPKSSHICHLKFQ